LINFIIQKHVHLFDFCFVWLAVFSYLLMNLINNSTFFVFNVLLYLLDGINM